MKNLENLLKPNLLKQSQVPFQENLWYLIPLFDWYTDEILQVNTFVDIEDLLFGLLLFPKCRNLIKNIWRNENENMKEWKDQRIKKKKEHTGLAVTFEINGISESLKLVSFNKSLKESAAKELKWRMNEWMK